MNQENVPKQELKQQQCPETRIGFYLQKGGSIVARQLPIFMGAVVFAIALILWQALESEEHIQISRQTELAALNVKNQLSEQIQERIWALVSMANRWEKLGKPTEELWVADATLYLKQFDGYQAIEWVDSSYHVRWIVPVVGNEKAKNLYLTFEDRRRLAIEEARQRNRMTISPTIDLVKGGMGFLVYVPLFRNQEFDGFILGVFRIEELLDAILQNNADLGYAIAIFEGDRLLYVQNKNNSFDRREWIHETTVNLEDVTWRVRISPTPELLDRLDSPLPEGVLGLGTAIAGLVTWAVHLAQTARRQKRQVEVAKQTLELEIRDRRKAEAALQASEKLFRNAFDSAATGLALVSPNRRWLQVNRSLCEMLGYSDVELLATDFQAIVHPEDLDTDLAYIHQLLEGKILTYQVEKRYFHKQGDIIWVCLSVSLVRDLRGKPFYFIFQIHDVSDRKHTEQSLRESEEKYRLLFSSELDAISVFDLETGQFVEVNTAFLELYGYGNERDNPIRMVGSHTDITDRKEAEAALRQSEERFRAAVEGSLDAFFLLQSVRNEADLIEDFTFIDLNSRAEKMISRSQAETIGQRLCEVLPIARIRGLFEKYVRVVETNLPIEEEFSVETPEGQTIWLHHQIIRVNDGIAITAREISDRKQAQEALQQANEKLRCWVNELEQRNTEMTLLNQMSDLLQACLTSEEAYQVISQIVPSLFPNTSGGVFTISNSRNLVEAVTTWGTPVTTQILFLPHECIALRRGQSHLMEHTHSGFSCKHLLHPFPSSYCCIPMVAQGEAMGVLYIGINSTEANSNRSNLDLIEGDRPSPLQNGKSPPLWQESPLPFSNLGQKHPFTTAKQQLSVTVARQIALALANLKLYETLQQQSIRDPLTGLFNRRYLEESVEREVRRADRNHQTLGIIILDVDHFKQFNDTFGHDSGDEVLRQLGMFLQQQMRGADIACRYGGEEFMLLLPEASLETTRIRAEQICKGVKHLKVQHKRQPLGAITLSLGVAIWPEHGINVQTAIQAADAALYQAKRCGRDRVVLASFSGTIS